MPPAAPSITNADEAKIVAMLGSASRRWLYMAPGVSLPLAQAMESLWERLGGASGSVILDVDPEVYRLGYGTVEGLQRLQEAAARHGTLICRHQEGVRIGLVISDDHTLIFTPTPLLIEAGSTHADHPNAIELFSVPEAVARDVGLGPQGVQEQLVGLDSATSTDIEQTKADLAKNPPVKFDIARKVRVFNAQLEFVEFEMEGCNVSRHTATIPPELLGLAEDEDMQERLRSSFKVIGDRDIKDEKTGLSEKQLQKKKQSIIKTYLRSVPGFGIVIRRDLKEAFEKEVEQLRASVAAFKKLLTQNLEAVIADNAARLTDRLLPSVRIRMPREWVGSLGLSPKDDLVRSFLHEQILRSFGSAEDFVKDMAINLTFKGVTYETLSNEEFQKGASKHFPDVVILDEFDAAKGAH
ncbi:MAG: hypothetical protein HS117_19515 [Verrucomicrobiaceae bacterium]|nr:hypothetical protein [Verrucomicrobiaceae bacterium]